MIKSVFAQIENPVIPGFKGKEPAVMVGEIISGILGVLLVGAGLFSFFYLLMGGLQWITSGGDKAGIDAARQRILNALIGLLIVFSTWAAMRFIFAFLGIEFPTFKLPSLVGE